MPGLSATRVVVHIPYYCCPFTYCCSPISLGITCRILLAWIFVKILYSIFSNVMGLQLLKLVSSPFLYISVMTFLTSLGTALQSSQNYIKSRIYFFIFGQNDLQNSTEIPSGPGDLPFFIVLTAFSISSTVRGCLKIDDVSGFILHFISFKKAFFVLAFVLVLAQSLA